MPPDPLSYNMSDVNPHLTPCEPPPYIKAGSAPVITCTFINDSFISNTSKLDLIPLIRGRQNVSVPQLLSDVCQYLSRTDCVEDNET